MRELNQQIILILLLFIFFTGVFPNVAKAGCWGDIELITSVEPYYDVRCKDMSRLDLSDRPDLPATLQFNLDTIWPAPDKMPAGCDPNQILNDAMNPGLGIRALHQQGITGAGVNVAIIDQAMYLDHPEFAGKIAAYYDLAYGSQSSMHGPAVTSLLVGTNCGTAPDAKVYYCAARGGVYEVDYARALNWIIQQNESIPDSEKIRVVSVSAAPGEVGYPSESGEPTWSDARAKAEINGILVLDCTSAYGFIGRCWYDVNDSENIAKCTPGPHPGDSWFDPADILTPAALRTTAEEVFEGDHSYIYWGSAGTSWTRPYCSGVLAMGWQIRPELTGNQMIELLFQSAYIKENGAKIINPPAFVSLLETNNPAIELSKEEFTFYTDSNIHNPDSQTLLISNSLLGTLNWTIEETCDWLQISPNSGVSTGEDDINAVTLSIKELPPGTHTCQFTISDPCAINNPQTIKVSLLVYTEDYGNKLHVPSEYETIQSAINAAEEGDTIIIAPGSYTGVGNHYMDFMGKSITIRSVDPDNPNIVASTIIDCNSNENQRFRAFRFHSKENISSILAGLTITGCSSQYGGAILCQNCSPTIKNCNFIANKASSGGGAIENEDNGNPTLIGCTFRGNSALDYGGGIRNHKSNPKLLNCMFIGNSANNGGGIQNQIDSNPVLINCTFIGNLSTDSGGGIYSDDTSSLTMTNCILWDNRNTISVGELTQINGGTPIINYSCIQGWTGGLGGIGNIGANPLFADAENCDYHLKSQAGRWDPESESWIMDDVTSLCIDAGDPNSDWTAELWPHGRRINMGAYGGTPQASMSTNNVGNTADFDNDGFVGFADIIKLTNRWLDTETLIAEDLDRNGAVDYGDFAILGANWHNEQSTSSNGLESNPDQTQ